MLTIRTPQLQALADDRVARLVDELWARVRSAHPATTEALGAEAARALVSRCLQRCQGAGFVSRAAVTRAVDGLFGHRARLLADGDGALASVIAELEAEALRSLLETVGSVGSA
jgi:hypothetical protein